MKVISLNKIKWVVMDMSDISYFNGWGNGYVIVPKEHPWYGKEEDDINYDLSLLNVDIHGYITFSKLVQHGGRNGAYKPYIGKWLIGFDTNHGYETKETWNEARVIEETKKLYKAAIDILKL
jgi:hypothetical protein